MSAPDALARADLLLLNQWLSPGFPIGGFAYSQGLETLVSEGQLTDGAGLQAWIEATLGHGALRTDAILLAEAWRGREGVDELARALVSSAERLAETLGLGAAFARTVREVWGLDLAEAPYPVAMGQAAFLRGVPLGPVLQVFVQSQVAQLVTAGVKLVPLGQTEGQAILARLGPLILATADHAQASGLEDIATSTLAADIASMRHETLPSRSYLS